MSVVQSYRDLIAWQKAIELADAVYRATSRFPAQEVYGLSSQIRRSAVSVPSNIAEGQAKLTTGEFMAFQSHARGSLAELETQMILAGRLGYMTDAVAGDLEQKAAEVGRLLNGLIASLRAKKGRRATQESKKA